MSGKIVIRQSSEYMIGKPTEKPNKVREFIIEKGCRDNICWVSYKLKT